MSSVLHLTPRHIRIYEFILKFKSDHDGVAPSVTEICAGTEISSTSMVRHYFNALVVLGMIKVDYSGRRSRMISIPGARWVPPMCSSSKSTPAPRAERARSLLVSSIPE